MSMCAAQLSLRFSFFLLDCLLILRNTDIENPELKKQVHILNMIKAFAGVVGDDLNYGNVWWIIPISGMVLGGSTAQESYSACGSLLSTVIMD